MRTDFGLARTKRKKPRAFSASFLFFAVAVLPSAMVSAQSWTELDTLTFDPVGFDRSLSNDFAAVPTREADSERASLDGLLQDELAPQFVISRIRGAVDDIESAEAVYGEGSPRLVPLLRTLADIYREAGDIGDAIAILERAQQIVRRWEGLYSLDQVELIQQMIEMGNTPNEQLNELESDLGELVRRNPGDPRNIGILTGMAGRQMDAARDLLINGLPPQFLVNVDLVGVLGGPRSGPPPTARAMAGSMLRRARSNYGFAMFEAVNRTATNVPELLELEQTIIDTYYFELKNSGLRRRGQPYRAAGRLRFGGVNALNAKLENSRRYPGTPEAYSSALVELADWHLMFSSFGRAMGLYDEALNFMREQDGGEQWVASTLSREAPVPLPAFVPNENVYSGLGNVNGYVDVEIKINRYGGVRDVKIRGQSENASYSVARRLKRFVYQTRFRPRYVEGEWQHIDRFTLRYEFAYTSS